MGLKPMAFGPAPRSATAPRQPVVPKDLTSWGCDLCSVIVFSFLMDVQHKATFITVYIHDWGGGLAQWLERWTGDLKVEGSNPVRSTRKTEFFRVKNVVLTRCRCAQPPCVCIRTHTKYHVRTLKIL